MAALIVSVLSAILSWNAYQVSKSNRDDSTSPKLTVSEVGLAHPHNKIIDIPVLAYQIKNYGNLLTTDIHTYIQYRYAVAPIDTQKLVRVGTNKENNGLGTYLVPGEYFDRAFSLLTYLVETKPAPNQTFSAAKDHPSYQKLRNGSAILQVEISTEANDSAGHRIIQCEAFTYQWITNKF